MDTPLLTEGRQQKIMDILRARGSARVSELAATFGVATMTVRRDLDAMAQRGWVRRYYGGVVLEEGLTEAPRSERLEAHHGEKLRIGSYVAGRLRGCQTVILDSGSTTMMVAQQIAQNPWDLTVLTNDPNIAVLLASSSPDISVMLAGGLIRPNTVSAVGEFAESFFAVTHADVAVMAVNGLSLDHGLMNSNLLEWSVKKAMIKAADKTFVVADHSKFESKATYVYATWDEVDCVVSGQEMPPDQAQRVRDANVNLITV